MHGFPARHAKGHPALLYQTSQFAPKRERSFRLDIVDPLALGVDYTPLQVDNAVKV